MTTRLSMLVLALVAFGCGDDPAPKKDFLEPCTNETSTSAGTAGAVEQKSNCKSGMQCRPVGATNLCTTACGGNADCAPLAPSGYVGVCTANNCTVNCTQAGDCSRFGLECRNAEYCVPGSGF